MNLTEPQAGSDVGALATKAVPADDGTLAHHRARRSSSPTASRT